MNMYGGPIDQYVSENDSVKGKRSSDTESASAASKYNVKKPNLGELALSEDLILEITDKYNLTFMTCEEEEAFLSELNQMGILTKEDCEAYLITGGNMKESLTRQIGADINLLYKMAIAGRYSNQHIEHIKSQQKILDILEQLAV